MFQISKRQLAFHTAVLTGTLMLLIPAFYNGYPLVNSDDGTYINSGFLPEVPGDRPIIYGLLLRIFSLNGISLWIALFIQTWTVSWLLLKIIESIGDVRTYLIAIATYLLLTFTTSLSWVTSQIVPDICTPIVMMCMYLILAGKENKWNTVLLYCIFLAASGTHISHFVIFMLLLACLFLFRNRFFQKENIWRVNKAMLILALLSLTANFVNASVYSNSKHVFLIGSLLDKKILKPYLHEVCPDKSYKLCKYADGMGDDPNWFIWNEDSPLYKEGGWSATKEEYNQIIKGIFTSPRYLLLFAEKSALFTWYQLLNFKIGDGNFPFKKDNHVYWAVENHVPNDITAYMNAWQHQELILPELELPNKIIYSTAIVSLFMLPIVIILKRKSLSRSFYLFLFLSLGLVLINAWDCATFSNVLGRYQGRVMWLVPFSTLLALAHLFFKPKSTVA